jgi:hypothetical protein
VEAAASEDNVNRAPKVSALVVRATNADAGARGGVKNTVDAFASAADGGRVGDVAADDFGASSLG